MFAGRWPKMCCGLRNCYGAGGKEWGRVYGGPSEVRNDTICNKNSYWKIKASNCQISTMLGKTATRHRRSESISVGWWWWFAVGLPYYSHRELLKETKAGRWCNMGMGGFCSSLFGQ